jgi:hypothetical protein
MTVVNKVCIPSFFYHVGWVLRSRQIVCGFGAQLFDELLAPLHPVHRLRAVCHGGEETWDDLFPQSRRGGRQGVVPDKLFVGQRHLYGVEELGESKCGAPSTTRRLIDVSSQQFLTIPVYTIFKNLTIILIVGVLC